MTDNLYEQDETTKRWLDEARGIKRFYTVDGETLMNKQINHKEHIVSDVLPVGLTLLAGAPKAGKSYFTLSLCIAVARVKAYSDFRPRKARFFTFHSRIQKTESKRVQCN